MFPSLMRIPINAGSLCNVKYISISKLNKDVCIIKLSKLKSSQLSTCFHYNQDSPGTQVQSLDQEGPLEKGMATTPVFLPGEFHGQRSLEGYSPWDCKESDMTGLNFTSFHLTL